MRKWFTHLLYEGFRTFHTEKDRFPDERPARTFETRYGHRRIVYEKGSDTHKGNEKRAYDKSNIAFFVCY